MMDVSSLATNARALDILTALPTGSVAVFDRDLRYVFAAGQGLAEVGLSSESLVGRTLFDVFPGDAVREVEPEYRRALEGEAVVFSLSFFHRVYSISAAPFRSAGGEVQEILAVIQDITQLLPSAPSVREPAGAGELQEKLDADERLIGVLGHELRSPLSAMAGAIAVIERSDARPVRERAREVLQRQVRYVGALTETLLDVSRARRGVLPLRFDDVDMHELLAEAMELVQHSADGQSPTLRVEAPAEARLKLRADRQRLTQVVTNLVTNALRHTPVDGSVIVRCERTGDGVEIAVCDSGSGLDSAQLTRIFEPFHQGDTTSGIGLGLGLWLCREIALMHGGRIDAASEGVGAGATFTVRLPLALVIEPAHDAVGHSAS
jgi:signal transduction histidine kinase